MTFIQILTYVINNWSIIFAAICVIIYMIQRIWNFIALPTASKKKELQERLLEWVRQAEAELGSGTGKFKLSQVYDKFCAQYPEMKRWFTLEQFESFVNEALKEMEKQFQNEKVKVNALSV